METSQVLILNFGKAPKMATSVAFSLSVFYWGSWDNSKESPSQLQEFTCAPAGLQILWIWMSIDSECVLPKPPWLCPVEWINGSDYAALCPGLCAPPLAFNWDFFRPVALNWQEKRLCHIHLGVGWPASLLCPWLRGSQDAGLSVLKLGLPCPSSQGNIRIGRTWQGRGVGDKSWSRGEVLCATWLWNPLGFASLEGLAFH